MPGKIEWYYHRNGWNTCSKTQEFLAKNKIEVKEILLSSKQTIKWDAAEKILKGVKEVYSSRGKKTTHLKIETIKKQKEEIEKIILGPTGNLRAPSIITDGILIVGFNEETYNLVLNS